MSTATETQTSGGQYVDFDEYIDYQLTKTRSQVKWTDLLGSVVYGLLAVAGYLLAFVICDHWVIPGGFSPLWRIGLFSLLATFVVSLVVRTLRGPALKQVQSLYAAQLIERADPELRSTLLNWVDLQNSGQPLPAGVERALRRRAAVKLSDFDVEHAIDRRPLLRWAYVLLAIVGIGAIYTILSPKDVFPSVKRALLPTITAAPATQTQIAGVAPEETSIPTRSPLTVEADIHGKIPEQVRLFYSTADRNIVDDIVVMHRIQDGLPRFRGVIHGENGKGVTQNLSYRIVAGDARTRDYEVTVIQPPAARIDEVRLEFPAYMKLAPKTTVTGEIDGWEGAKVTLHATANMPIQSAALVMTDAPDAKIKGEEIQVEIRNGINLSAAWPLTVRADGTTPKFYHIRCRTADGKTNPEPTHYPLKIRPDMPPDVAIVSPTGDLELPANGRVPLFIEAADPDFELRALTLRVERKTDRLADQPLFENVELGSDLRRVHEFKLEPLHLRAGDVIHFWVEARDNKQPVANARNTPKLQITITDKVSEEEAKREFEKQLDQDKQDEPRTPEEAPAPDEKVRPRQPNKPDEKSEPDDQQGEKTNNPQPGTSDNKPDEGTESEPLDPTGEDFEKAMERVFKFQQEKDQDEQPPKDQGQPEPQKDTSEKPQRGEHNPDQPNPRENPAGGGESPEQANPSRPGSTKPSPSKGGTGENKQTPRGNPPQPGERPENSPMPSDTPSPGDDSERPKTKPPAGTPGAKSPKTQPGNDPQRSPESNPKPGAADPQAAKPNTTEQPSDPSQDAPKPPRPTGDKTKGEREKPGASKDKPKTGEQPGEKPDANRPDSTTDDGPPREKGPKPETTGDRSTGAEKNAPRQSKATGDKPQPAEAEKPGTGSDKDKQKPQTGKKPDGTPADPQGPDSQPDPGQRPKTDATKTPADEGVDPTKPDDTGKKPDAGKPGKPSGEPDVKPTPDKKLSDMPDPDGTGTSPSGPPSDGGTDGKPEQSETGPVKDPSKGKSVKPSGDKASQPGEGPGENTRPKPPSEKAAPNTGDPADEPGESTPAEATGKEKKRQSDGTPKGPAEASDDADPDAVKAKGKVERKDDKEGAVVPNDDADKDADKPERGSAKPDAQGKRRTREATEDDKNDLDKPKGRGSDDAETAKPAPDRKTDGMPDATGAERANPDKTRNPDRKPSEQGGQPDGTNEDLKGPGKKDGQKSDQPQGGEAGASSAAEKGTSGGQKPGPGDDSDQAPAGADSGKADKPTGKPGKEPGQGSTTKPSGKKDAAGKKPSPGAAKPGAEAGAEGAGEAGSEAGEGEGSGSGSSSEGGQGGSAGSKPSGGDSPRSNRGADDAGSAGGSPTIEPDSAPSEEELAERNRQASNLVLRQLKDQLEEGNVDPELLKKLGWNEEQLRKFTERLEQNLNDEADDNSPQAEARRRRFEEFLKSFQIESKTRKQAAGTTSARSGPILQNDTQVPPEYRDQYEAFTKSRSKAKK